ncbi:alpha/beta hydrolase [Flavivirga aquatica]|uniref:Alpha/beta hydrolase n=1 Tax=Flavivirga aquatica TaxID=1849968 RepID=A0A1E5T9L3_9FLAO|nr:alpha/beta hydrolase [Flavivirga aquatica]OEK08026.1 alpha/beta hydrolase [Flavivirga aquatica]
MKKYLPKIIGFIINLISCFSSQYAAKLAIQLFSTPKKGRLNNSETLYLESSIQEEIIHESISIKTYRWNGKKDTILLAHGWESNSYRWKDLIELLIQLDHTVIALDAPGHGGSGSKYFNALLYSDCIHAVAKKFDVSTIIGHSVGGMSIVFSQHKYKSPSIKKLILLGAPADFLGVLKSYEQMMGYSKKVSNAITQYVLKHYNHLPEYFSASEFSKSIKAKGLIIHDKKDRIIPYKDGLKFKQNYTNSEFVATKGFGHGLKSDIVYQHILEFINA